MQPTVNARTDRDAVYDSYIHITQPDAKKLYLTATFRLPTANFIRHMVTWHWRWARDQNTVIGRWKVIGPRISVHTVGILRIDSLSCLVLRWPSLSLRSWHRTNQWHDSLLSRDPLWLTCWFLLPNLSDLPVSMFCCWWIPLLFCAPLVSLHNSGLFLQCTYCCSYGTESRRHTHLSGLRTRSKANPIFGWSLALSRIIITLSLDMLVDIMCN